MDINYIVEQITDYAHILNIPEWDYGYGCYIRIRTRSSVANLGITLLNHKIDTYLDCQDLPEETPEFFYIQFTMWDSTAERNTWHKDVIKIFYKTLPLSLIDPETDSFWNF